MQLPKIIRLALGMIPSVAFSICSISVTIAAMSDAEAQDGVYCMSAAVSLTCANFTSVLHSIDDDGSAHSHSSAGNNVCHENEQLPVQKLDNCDVPICKVDGKFEPFDIEIFEPTSLFNAKPGSGVWSKFSFDGISVKGSVRGFYNFDYNSAACGRYGVIWSNQDVAINVNDKTYTDNYRSESTVSFRKIRTDAHCGVREVRSDTSNTTGLLRDGLVFNGPYDANRCISSRIQVSLLSPFAYDARGGSKPDARRYAIMVGQSAVSGVAADGASKAIIGVVTPDRSTPVLLQLGEGGIGALEPFSERLFSASSGGSSQLQIDPASFVKIGPSRYVAIGVYVAPAMPSEFPGTHFVKINARQGRATQTTTTRVVSPPIVYVHGLWSDPATWAAFRTGAGAAFSRAYSIKYNNADFFDSVLVQNSFMNQINSVIDSTRSSGIIASRVLIVAHSMGALTARATAKHHSQYSTNSNFNQGAIARIISINTPHGGSELARILLKMKDSYIEYGFGRSRTLSDFMASQGFPIAGAVESLAPNSRSLKSLRGGAELPYETVGSFNESVTGLRVAINTALFLAGWPDVNRVFKGRPNDVIVSTESQLSGSVSPPMLFAGYDHTGSVGVLDSSEIASFVHCRLLNYTSGACPLGAVPAVSKRAPPADAGGGFSIVGRTPVPADDVILNNAELELGVPSELHALSPNREIEAVLYMWKDGDEAKQSIVSGDDALLLTPQAAGTIVLTAVLAYRDGTYAIRDWRFKVRPTQRAAFLDLGTDVVTLTGAGSTFRLHPTILLNDSPTKLDVSHAAKYRLNRDGRRFVAVSKDGVLTARKSGRAELTVWYGELSKAINVTVYAK